MQEVLDDIMETLVGLLDSGYGAVHQETMERMKKLAAECENHGLHQGAELLSEGAELLEVRNHQEDKNDLAISDVICQLVCYENLCRGKLDSLLVQQRWKQIDENRRDEA